MLSATNMGAEMRVGLAAAMAAACLSMYPLAPVADEPVIGQWKGTGLTTTRPFHAAGPWELQWEASGLFQVFLHRPGHDESGEMPDIIANQVQGSKGSAYVDHGGDFYLQISALAPWTARAVLVSTN
jgi:hypothetical protein